MPLGGRCGICGAEADPPTGAPERLLDVPSYPFDEPDLCGLAGRCAARPRV